ncbi:extracellular solute-binding protein [Actinomadura atramentaria]|uniref:extracellular solute-binding protein n=1 Tax=Actinomadura atramentaria TaxID=1990 RepID=UPI00039BCDA2|nr:extracellular solute-binding protein [Actinomadura atramentaria]
MRPGLLGVREHPVLAAVFALAGALLTAFGAAVLPSSGSHLPDVCDDSRLVVAGGTDVSFGSQRRALVEAWNDNDGGVRGSRPPARLVEVSPSSDLQRAQLKAVEESGSCAYDVLVLDAPWTAEFAARHWVRPLRDLGLTAADTRDFFTRGLEMGSYEHELYALPFNLDVGLLYYRDPSRLPRAPGDWPQENYIEQLGDYEGLVVNALEAVWNHGGDGVLTGERIPDAAELRRAYRALRGVAATIGRPGPLHDSYWSGYRESQSLAAFAKADGSAVLRHWPYAYQTLANEPGLRDDGKLEFGVEAAPGSTVLGGQTLAVSARSRHARDALALVKFLTGDQAERRLYSCGGFAPTRAAVLGVPPEPGQDARVLPVKTCGEIVRSATGADPDNPAGAPEVMTGDRLTALAQAIVTALSRARPRPVTAYYSAFSATLRECAHAVFTGSDPGEDAFAAAVAASLHGKWATCAP